MSQDRGNLRLELDFDPTDAHTRIRVMIMGDTAITQVYITQQLLSANKKNTKRFTGRMVYFFMGIFPDN